MQKKTTPKTSPAAAKKTVKKVTKKAVKKTVKKTAAKKTAVKKKAAAPPLSSDQQFAIEAARIARDLHCTDIVLLDLTGLSPATDYFLIATGTSDRQSRTVADEISMLAKKKFNLHCFGTAGYDQGQWILLDFVSVVVHVFNDKYRDYYNLEMLWGDAKKIDY
jgi:ribosome-associated protein